MLKSFIFTSVFGDKMTVSAYDTTKLSQSLIILVYTC